MFPLLYNSDQEFIGAAVDPWDMVKYKDAELHVCEFLLGT